jgi:hypothetical protein
VSRCCGDVEQSRRLMRIDGLANDGLPEGSSCHALVDEAERVEAIDYLSASPAVADLEIHGSDILKFDQNEMCSLGTMKFQAWPLNLQ